MTAKRFTIKHYESQDWAYDNGTYIDTRMMVELLNNLHEENNLLKDIIKDIVVQLDTNHTSHTYQMTIPINKVIYNELKRKLKETSFNEELRRFFDDY